MPERASLLQATQIGIEVTPGTAVAANKRLLATSIDAGIEADVKLFRPMGQKFSTLAALGKESVSGDISGQLSYTDWVYLMAGGIAYAAPAQQAATTAYKWTASMAQAVEDTIKTYTVEVGGAIRAHKFAHAMINNLGYTVNHDEVNVKGSIIGHALTDGITMTATPTDIALVPVLPTQFDVYMDTTSAGLGTTKLTRAFDIDFETGDRFEPVWAIDSAQSSFATYVEAEMEPKLSFKAAADAVGMSLLTNMRAGTKTFIRVKATGSLIASTYYYTFQHDLCCVVSAAQKFEDMDGVYAIGWELTPVYDSGWGKSMEFQITNMLTAL